MLVGGVSEGCAVVNDAQFDGFYISAGVNLPFKAGEIVSAHSEEPSTETAPTQIIIRNASNNLATAAWPGTAEYTIPAAGENHIGWATDTNAQRRGRSAAQADALSHVWTNYARGGGHSAPDFEATHPTELKGRTARTVARHGSEC